MNKQFIISILGDSISTFQGVTPEGSAFYGSWNRSETRVITPEDTWWMKVIRALDGHLGTNNSMAGTMVCGVALFSGTSARRILDLGSNGNPDMILVAMGANDWGFRVLPQEFETEYAKMLAAIKMAYPYADIWCATLPEAKPEPGDEISFFNVDGCISKRVYSDIIRKLAVEADVHLADLGAHPDEYSTIDGAHPDKEGMETLAELWIRELQK